MSRKLSIGEKLANARGEIERPTVETATAVIDAPEEVATEAPPVEPSPPSAMQTAMAGLRKLYEDRRAADEKLYESAVRSEAENRPLDCTTETLCGCMERLGRKPETFESDVQAVRDFLQSQSSIRQVVERRRQAVELLVELDGEVKQMQADLERKLAVQRELQFRSRQGPLEISQARSRFNGNEITAKLFAEWETSAPGGILAGA